jgi:hypothetical protein
MVLMLLLMMGMGGRIGPNLIQALVTQRRVNFERWKAFVDFAQGIVTQGYFLWRGAQVVKNADGSIATSNEAIIAKLDANQKDSLQQWFFSSVMEKGTKLIMELLAPSAIEEQMMLGLLSANNGALPGTTPSTQNIVVQQPTTTAARKPTAREVRNSGGRAQGVILTSDGIFEIG